MTVKTSGPERVKERTCPCPRLVTSSALSNFIIYNPSQQVMPQDCECNHTHTHCHTYLASKIMTSMLTTKECKQIEVRDNFDNVCIELVFKCRLNLEESNDRTCRKNRHRWIVSSIGKERLSFKLC